jgi:hypothetical protein
VLVASLRAPSTTTPPDTRRGHDWHHLRRLLTANHTSAICTDPRLHRGIFTVSPHASLAPPNRPPTHTLYIQIAASALCVQSADTYRIATPLLAPHSPQHFVVRKSALPVKAIAAYRQTAFYPTPDISHVYPIDYPTTSPDRGHLQACM